MISAARESPKNENPRLQPGAGQSKETTSAFCYPAPTSVKGHTLADLLAGARITHMDVWERHGSSRAAHHVLMLRKAELAAVVRKVIDAAKSGDMAAARLVIDKLVPAAKDRPINIGLPSIADAPGCTAAQAGILAAVAAGEILPSEGETLSGLVEHQRRAIETNDIVRRLELLEAERGQ